MILFFYIKWVIFLFFFVLPLHAEESPKEIKGSVVIESSDGVSLLKVWSFKRKRTLFKNNYLGDTPIHYLPFNEDFLNLAWLHEVGVEAINAQNNLGDTPLHRAAARGDAEFALALLQSGADPNIQNKRGETPLHQVIPRLLNVSQSTTGEGSSSYFDPALTIIEALLDYKADPNIQNKRGETSLYLALMKGNTTVIEWLQAIMRPEAVLKDLFLQDDTFCRY